MTFKTASPQIGDIGLVRITGLTGKLVSFGQRLIGSGSYFTHAFVYVGNGMVVQVQPGGAEIVSLAEAVGNRRVAYSSILLSVARREAIADYAKALEGTPYSFLDYAAIGMRRLLRSSLLERFVGDSRHMICSQLADEAYAQAGIHLFPNRLAGDVTPGDIARLIGAT